MRCEIDYILKGEEKQICTNHAAEDFYLQVGDREEAEKDGGGEIMTRSRGRVN